MFVDEALCATVAVGEWTMMDFVLDELHTQAAMAPVKLAAVA